MKTRWSGHAPDLVRDNLLMHERIAAQDREIERLTAMLDQEYCNGARQAAAIAHQSIEALDEWIAKGCGNRHLPVNGNEKP